MTHTCVWHDSCIHVTYLLHMCDMTHTHVWHDSYICITWLLHMRDVTHMCVWQDSYTYTAWLIHTCDMTHIYVRLESYTCVAWLIYTQEKEKRGKREKQNSLFFLSLEKFLSLLEKFSFCPPLENGVLRKGDKWKRCPPNNGLNALWSATNPWYVVKCVSQKRNWSNNKH